MADPALAPIANPPAPAATIGQPIPETDPAYLAFAAGQGYRESEARAYTALRQNAIHQAYQDALPEMILAGQRNALATERTYGDAGAWRTGARLQEQGRDQAELQAQITKANDAQQSQQDDLQAQLADHVANLRMDTTQAALQARQNYALSQAALGQQAFVHGTTVDSGAGIPQPLSISALMARLGAGAPALGVAPSSPGATPPGYVPPAAPTPGPNNTQTNASGNTPVKGAS